MLFPGYLDRIPHHSKTHELSLPAMISFDEAYKIIQSNARSFGTEEIPLYKGIGRVLKEEWYCDRDLPPYNRVTMDGIALNYDGAQDQERLKIEHIVAAGDPQYTLMDKGNCVEIMTGAMLPENADTVIRYEDLTIKEDQAFINEPFKKHQNIHWQGEDRKKGELIVSQDRILSSSEIGLGASIGKVKINVSRLPRAIVISTGNELVEIHETPLPHQIRRGNIYRTQSTLNYLGVATDTGHLQDDKEEIARKMSGYLASYDLIILSGGVSKGKFDFLPEVLKECGVRQLFHRVAQRPGKPLWFGTHPNGATVFALPGNPISSFMCLHIYVLDWLWACLGARKTDRPKAVLTEDVHFKPELTYFLEVKLGYNKKGQITATPQKGNGSGDLANLTNADAFIQLPDDQNFFEKGSVFPVFRYRL